jgi:hypothetical protein
MEQVKKFSPEELEQIRILQEKYNLLGVQLVQLKLAQKNAKDYLEKLDEEEKILEQQIVETNKEEKQLAEEFDAKYGAGSLNLESGEFTPKTS